MVVCGRKFSSLNTEVGELEEQRINTKDSSWWRDLKGVWGMEE